MKSKLKTTGFALALFAAAAFTFSLTKGAASVSAASGGNLHAIKECSTYKGQPGGFCTGVRHGSG
jgi:hypothetical protein